jgi:GH3 auxin-responsive promoter
MLRDLRYRALHWLTLSTLRHEARQFDRALADPERSQRRILFDLLRRNANTCYGRTHGFPSIQGVADYQEHVPVVSYDDLAPWIERVKAGEPGVLSSEQTLIFEKSSGSASAAKYIPYTFTLQAQFHAALAPWITDLYRSFPGLDRGSAYWLITPMSRDREVTNAGIPVGFENDCDYFGSASRCVLRQTMAVPGALARVPNIDSCFYLTLRFLLRAPSLTFISVWNPSLLLILLDVLERRGDRLVCDLISGGVEMTETGMPHFRLAPHPAQGEKLRSMLRCGRIEPAILWPNLRVISCWTAAEAAPLVNEVQQRFPQAAIQGKGLLATEGVVSVPIERYAGCVAAVNSHFLEFMDHDSGQCRLVSELAIGKEYSVLLTTGGGFWRYQLGDRVRVTGFAKETPILEFLGKEDCVCDLRGEKLNARFVSQALSEFESCRRARFAMLAPSGAGDPGYILFLESPVCEPNLALLLDEMLFANPHYAYCRRIGQLRALRVFRIHSKAAEVYVQHSQTLGGRVGTAKLSALHKWRGWERVFCGSYMDSGNLQEVCA